jgi:gas vesicle protein
MKSIILVLLACVAVINCEVVQDKGLATDFLVDNILNPMLQGINQNALNYLLQQLLGKRSINFQDVTAQIQAALENNKDQIQQALTGIVSTIQNLISTIFPGQKDMATDFIIDNIVNPMLQAINTNAITFLMQQLLGGLLGKRSINIQDAAAQLQNFLNNNKDQIQQALTGIVSTIQNLISTVFPGQRDMATDFIIDNIINPMLEAINSNAITFLMQQLLGGLFGK